MMLDSQFLQFRTDLLLQTDPEGLLVLDDGVQLSQLVLDDRS